MATYKKRGYKPKTTKEKEVVEELDSTTAEVFNSLDEGASKAEEWVVKNQKYIISVIAVAALLTLAYMAYNRYVAEPKAKEAMNEMYTAKSYFDDAANGITSDSLYTLSLTGGEGKYGMTDIADKFSGTPAGNLANYYAGMAYLNLKNYESAIQYLDEFSSDDKMLSAISKGGIGDAFTQLEQLDKGLEYYEKAFKANTNDYTTPLYLLKAAKTAIELKKFDVASTYLKRIEDEFSTSEQANETKTLLGLVETSM